MKLPIPVYLPVLFTLCSIAQCFAQQPNIILIVADDLGWGDVGYAGAAFFETPNIDALAGNGMVFTEGYSAGPNCAPSRACIMSGMYTPRHRIYTPGRQAKGEVKYMRLLVPAKNRKDKELEAAAKEIVPHATELDPSFICIPEVLKPAGYASARLGKWHLGDPTQGFDLSDAGGGHPGGSYYDDIDVAERLTDKALAFIDNNKEGPFFLYLCHWDVHTPIMAREEVVARYQDKLDRIPESQRQNFDATYAAMIEAVDISVGRVVDKVYDLGLEEDTLIIFTSDNGGLANYSQLEPLRAMKGSLLEAGIRVPFVASWKGVIEAGSRCETPVCGIDFLPTFASLAGAALPSKQPVDGFDISPLFRGDSIPERPIFWFYPLYLSGPGFPVALPDGKSYSWRGVPSTVLRRGDYKLLELHEDNSIELYNIKSDPSELHNLVNTMPEKAASLRAEMDAWQAATNAPISDVPNPECILD